MAIQEIQKLDLGELLGSLLAAVVDAQQHSIRATLDLVQQIGFQTVDGEERMRTVTVRYTKLDENQQPAEYALEMPLLAMVSIPTIGVKSATIDFSFDVTESTLVEEGTQAPTVPEQPITRPLLPDLTVARPVLRGYIPRSSRAESNRRTSVDVSVVIEREPLPIGLERMFDLAELAMTGRPAEQEEE